MALTRQEQTPEGLVQHPNPPWSQDVWALRSDQPLPPALLHSLEIPLGVPRCDNKIVYLFAVHGWTLYNPVGEVNAVHVHETQQRSYNKKTDQTIMGGIGYLHPSHGLHQPSVVDLDIWLSETDNVSGVRLNRSQRKWMQQAAEAERQAAAPAPAALPPALTPAAQAAATQGRERCTDSLGRFRLVEHGSQLWAFDRLHPARARPVDERLVRRQLGDAALALASFIPPVLELEPVEVHNRAQASADLWFWQYPAATEKQALQNHLGLLPGSNLDLARKTLHTYLGLPWATFIDKKQRPDELLPVVQAELRGLHRLAEELGYRLRVHTVCQQIHWRRMVDAWTEMGITDVHLSHATRDIDTQAAGWPFQVHSWPLFAPNIEVPERRAGLVVGKRSQDKRYFASFVGAHMRHYRSDARLQLAQWAKASRRPNVMVEVGEEWHFNRVVYQEQVAHKALAAEDTAAMAESARRYNAVLSDSVFSLCPEGAGPNTLRLWESMAVGSIPVVVAPDWIAPTDAGVDMRESCIMVERDQVAQLDDILGRLTPEDIERRQRACIAQYQKLRRKTAFAAQAA